MCSGPLGRGAYGIVWKGVERRGSRRPVVESHAINSWPSHVHESGFFFAEEAVRTASSDVDRSTPKKPQNSTRNDPPPPFLEMTSLNPPLPRHDLKTPRRSRRSSRTWMNTATWSSRTAKP